MTVRDTSIDAYNYIRENGILGSLQWIVYSWLYENGPATQREVCVGLDSQFQDRSIMPRFAELERRGVIRVLSEENNRPCRISGHTVMLWDVTSAMPEPPAEPKWKEGKTYYAVIRQPQGSFIEEYPMFRERHHAEDRMKKIGGEIVKVRVV